LFAAPGASNETQKMKRMSAKQQKQQQIAQVTVEKGVHVGAGAGAREGCCD